ncbi:MAG TPA: protein kinase [Myxococcales bacterium]|jgi:serine/threonine-protein kinase
MAAPQLTKYRILGHLAKGGMADVWLAHVLGVAGFEKLVVVKTLLPELSTDANLTELFLREARLAARLNHPNCIQIFDLGQENGVYYIAMEFVDGCSLLQVLRRATGDLDRPLLPVNIASRIIMEAASGLDYAHRLADRDGKSLEIVHRDVSLDNVLIGFDGQVKVVDFGIAKARDDSKEGVANPKTKAGDVKGKWGYIPPEYLKGQPIDGRADLFALGVVFYRALTRKRPFPGDTEAMVTLAVINEDPIPPREHNPEISEALEAVVLEALEKDPANRIATGRDFRAAIAAATSPAEQDVVAVYMETLWPKSDPERTKVGAIIAGESTSTPSAVSQPSSLGEEKSLPRARVPGTRRFLPAAAGAAVLLAGIGIGVFAVGGGKAGPDAGAPPPAVVTDAARAPEAPDAAQPPGPDASAPESAVATGMVEVTSSPEATISYKGKVLGRTPGIFTVPVGQQVLVFSNSSLGLERGLAVIVHEGKTSKLNARHKKGWLDVRVSPWAEVRLDGKSLGTTPLPEKEVWEGKHLLELWNADTQKKKRLVIDISPGEHKAVKESLK